MVHSQIPKNILQKFIDVISLDGIQFIIIQGSNNWVLSGNLTTSGRALMSADPHLMINRSPGFWYEVIFKLNNQTFSGITLPGYPLIAMGSTI
jgi:acyl-homoserine lactone acylase PvdQ